MAWQRYSLISLGVGSPWGSPAGSQSTQSTGPGLGSGRSSDKETAAPGVSIHGPNGSALKFHGKEKKP